MSKVVKKVGRGISKGFGGVAGAIVGNSMKTPKTPDIPEPEKPKMSQLEKTQHAVAKAEWDHYKKQYHPVEDRYIADAQRDRSDRAGAQAASAVAREGTEAMRLSAAGGGVSGAASAVGNAMSQGQVGAANAERLERDGRVAGAVGIGRKLQANTASSLSTLGRVGAQGAIGTMQNKLRVDVANSTARTQISNARSARNGQIVGSLAGAGMAMGSGGQTAGAQPEVIDKGRTLNQFDSIF